MKSQRWAAAAVIAAVSTWGITFPLTKVTLDDFTAAQVALLRLASSLPLLAVLVWHVRKRRAPLRFAIPLAATGMVGFFLFTNLGLERTSASTGALVQASIPVLTAVLAVAALRERPPRAVVAGIALAVAGGALLAWGALELESPLGLVFLLLSSLSWAAYTVIGHAVGDRVDVLAATLVQTVLAAVVFAPVAAADDWDGARPAIWTIVVLSGLLGSGVAYLLWNFGVTRIPASHAGVYGNLSPVVALAVAWLALGESVGAREAAGGAVVLAGAVLASTQTLRLKSG